MWPVIWEDDWLLCHMNGCELLTCFDTFKDYVHAVSLRPWTEIWNTSVKKELSPVQTTGTYSRPYNKSQKRYHCDNHPYFSIFTSLLLPHESGLASRVLVGVTSQGYSNNCNRNCTFFWTDIQTFAMLASVWVLSTRYEVLLKPFPNIL